MNLLEIALQRDGRRSLIAPILLCMKLRDDVKKQYAQGLADRLDADYALLVLNSNIREYAKHLFQTLKN